MTARVFPPRIIDRNGKEENVCRNGIGRRLVMMEGRDWFTFTLGGIDLATGESFGRLTPSHATYKKRESPNPLFCLKNLCKKFQKHTAAPDSHVVSNRSTNGPIQGLSMSERTGTRVFLVL